MLLKELFTFLPKSKKSASSGLLEGKYPFFTSSNTIDKYINIPDYNGEFLIIGDGGTGNCKFYKGCFSVSDHNYVLQPKSGTNALCVQYFLKRDNYKILNDGFKGVGIKNVSKTYIENINYSYNKKFTEKVIVSNLINIELLIEKCKKQLFLFNELIKSRFIEMFGDENDEKWPSVRLEEIGECKNGMNFTYKNSGFKINCLGVGDFNNNSIISDTTKLPYIELEQKPNEDYLLKNEDIVFVRSNGNKLLVGRSVLVYPNNVPTVFSGFCIRFRMKSNNINSVYLLYALRTDHIRTKMHGRGANIQNLNQKILLNLNIQLPPKFQQDKFASFVEQIDKFQFVDLLYKRSKLILKIYFRCHKLNTFQFFNV